MKKTTQANNFLKRITIIQPFIFASILFSVYIFVLYSKTEEASLITASTRNNILIGDFRTTTQILDSITLKNFIKAEVIDHNKKIMLASFNKINEPLLGLNLITTKIYSSNSENVLVCELNFYFSLSKVLNNSFLIFILFTFLSIPLYFFLFIKLRNDLVEKNKIENELLQKKQALQMFHDIRSPLAALKTIADLEQKTNQNDLLKTSINRIQDIANSLLSNSSDKKTNIDIQKTITETLSLKKEEYKNQNFECKIEEQTNTITVLANKTELSRIISNLINNAFESKKDSNHSVKLTTKLEESNFIIEIQDNGKGIPKEIQKKLGTNSITTKESGNGLGLSHAFTKLNEWNGNLKIDSEENIGTTITISLPAIINEITTQQSSTYILVDDDELNRFNWEYKAKKAQKILIIYKSEAELLINIDQTPKDTIIFLDSELGTTKGEDLAVILHQKGFTNINITTGHPKEKFSHLTFLKDVRDKTPPF